MRAEGKDGHGDSQEGLAAAGRAFGERHIVSLYGGDVFLLAQSSGAYRFAAVGGKQHVTEETVEGFFFAVLYHLDGIAHLLCREAGASPDEGEQGGDGRDGASDPMGGAGDGQYISVGNEAAVKAFPQYLKQLVSPAEELVGFPSVRQGDAFLDDGQVIGRESGEFCLIFFRNIFLQSDSSFRREFTLLFPVLLGGESARRIAPSMHRARLDICEVR